MRLDMLLVRKNLVGGRDKAKDLIRQGNVRVDGQVITKPGQDTCETAVLEVSGELLRFVSRAGLKLQKALDVFQIPVGGAVCLDVGASTGGFTDCLLQSGAARVYAVDVGTNQLDAALKKNPRVVSLEQTDIRTLDADSFGGPVSLIAVDVSFISLAKILPGLAVLVQPKGAVICLVKPQFEAGKEHVGKHGVVKSSAVHQQVLESLAQTASAAGLVVRGVDYSPILGQQGNREYLLWLSKDASSPQFTEVFTHVTERAERFFKESQFEHSVET